MTTRGGAAGWTYAYDANGNPTRFDPYWPSPSYNADDQTQASAFHYDGDGNPASTHPSPPRTSSYETINNQPFSPIQYALSFDPEDRLGTGTNVTGGATFSATYDALGRRSAMAAPGTPHFVYDGDDRLLEVGASGVLAVNAFGPDGLVARAPVGGSETFYQFDPMGNTSARLPLSGGGSYDLYNGYGALQIGGGGTDPWGYEAQTGGYTDYAMGWLPLVQMGAREYDPQQGRFLTRDPIGLEGGSNLYSYADNNPVNEDDPDGLKAASDRDVLDRISDGAAGWGDWLTIGATGRIRHVLGVNDVVDYQSTSYHVGQAFGAANDIGYAAAKSFAVGTGKAIVWSGGKAAQEAAEQYARINGGKTLEMTVGGRIVCRLNRVTEPILPWAIRRRFLWVPASWLFVRNATGEVTAFVRGTRPGSVWLSLERPILQARRISVFYHR